MDYDVTKDFTLTSLYDATPVHAPGASEDSAHFAQRQGFHLLIMHSLKVSSKLSTLQLQY